MGRSATTPARGTSSSPQISHRCEISRGRNPCRRHETALGPVENGTAPKGEKAGAGPGGGKDQIRRVSALAKRRLGTLQKLSREKQNEAVEALGGIREWMNSAVVEVAATRVE